MLKPLSPVLRLMAAAFVRWLLRNLDPLAPNFPDLVILANHYEVPI